MIPFVISSDLGKNGCSTSIHIETGSLENIKSIWIFVKSSRKYHSHHFAVDDHFGALCTWGMGGVERRATCAHAVERGLDNCILFRMYADAGVFVLARYNLALVSSHTASTPTLVTVVDARWRTIVARGYNALVRHNHRPHLWRAQTTPTLGNNSRQLQKILIPTRPGYWFGILPHMTVCYLL